MWRIFAAILSGILLILSFPSFDFGALAWICLVPLLLASRDTSTQRAFGLGWLTGLIAFCGLIYWIAIAVHQHGEISLPASVFTLLMLAGYLATFVAVFSSLATFFSNKFSHPSLLLWSAPAAWVTLEIIRTHAFTGFPWALLGYSQYKWLTIIQIADITGVYGISFLIVLGNALITLIIQFFFKHLRRHQIPSVTGIALSSIITVIIFVLTLTYGEVKQTSLNKTHDTRTIKLALIQPNIEQSQKWNPAFQKEIMDRYKSLTMNVSKEDKSADADMIVWPEAATPFVFAEEDSVREQIVSLVQKQKKPLIFGSIALRKTARGKPHLLNRAYLLSSQGTILNHYDKIHLVPFGEYVPPLLSFIDKLANGIGDYIPGTRHTILGGPHGRFGVAICFEVIYPSLVRKFIKGGAEYMITITNDAWYDQSSAPYQHFSMVVFRAIENRISFARAANTGISGFINPDGSIKSRTNLLEQTTITDTVTLGYDQTIYTAYGDVFAYTCTLITLGLILLPATRRRTNLPGSTKNR